jgi:hypothetical protein
MNTVDCQHCGACLILPEGVTLEEVRCKRCGRKTALPHAGRNLHNKSHRPSAPRPPRTVAGASLPAFERATPERGSIAPDPVLAHPARASVAAPVLAPPINEPSAGRRGRGVLYVAIGIGMLSLVATVGIGAAMFFGRPAPQLEKPTSVAVSEPAPQNSAGNRTESGTVGGAETKAPMVARATPVTTVARAATPAAGVPSAIAPPTPAPAPKQPSLAPVAIQRGTTGLAKSIGAKLAFNKVVYANSEIALAEVEAERLAVPAGKEVDWFVDRFSVSGAADGAEPKPLELVCRAQFISQLDWLNATRPVFSVYFTNAPTGTNVRVEIELRNAAGRRLLSGGQATKQESVHLAEGAHPECVWLSKDEHDSDLWEIGLQPQWDVDELAKLTAPETITMSVSIKYGDGSEDERMLETVTIMPPDLVETSYPMSLGFVGMVNEGHPWVERILNQINQCSLAKRTGMSASGGAGADRSFFAVFLLWRELKARGLRYSSLSGSVDHSAQETRSIHETLLSQNANCVDGTILVCSFLEKMGISSMILMPPGHAFAAFMGEDGIMWGLETTRLGDDDVCSPEFRTAILKMYPDLAEIANKSLSSTESRDFNCFLKAVESGEQKIAAASEHLTHGIDKKPSVKQLLEMLGAEEDPEKRKSLISALGRDYTNGIWVSRARQSHVLAIPVPKDLDAQFKLPPQPVKTR